MTKGLEKTGREIPGRPLSLRLAQTILALEPDELYPPSKVARRIVDPLQERQEYQKWRKRAGDWVRYHCKEPDGQKGSFNAWLGSTWQEFLDPADRRRAEKCQAKLAQAQQRRGHKKIWSALAAGVAAAAVLFAFLVQAPDIEPEADTIDFEPTMFPATSQDKAPTPDLNTLFKKEPVRSVEAELDPPVQISQADTVPTSAGTDISTLEFARKMQQLHRSWHLQTFSHDAFVAMVEADRETAVSTVMARVVNYPFLLTRSNIAMTPAAM